MFVARQHWSWAVQTLVGGRLKASRGTLARKPGKAGLARPTGSVDGESWKLDLKNKCLDTSSVGWDSEMVEYPFVFDHAAKRYMLYNGNGYGKTGFGLAVLSD